jgi:hypothetical protein
VGVIQEVFGTVLTVVSGTFWLFHWMPNEACGVLQDGLEVD